MKKEVKLMIVGIVVIILVTVAMFTAKSQKKTEVSEPDDVTVTDLLYREEIKDNELPESVFADYEKSLVEANNILVEKVIRTTVEYTDGNYSTSYDSYVVSEVNFVKGTDDTEDFTSAVSAKEYDDSLIKQVSFNEGFGFSYEGISAFDLYKTVLEKEGFDGKLTDVTLDEERTKLTGQNNYIINSEGSIIKRLLPDYESKDVIEKKAYFQTIKEGDTEVLEFFVALVKYRDGEKVIEKSIYLQVSVNNWEVV